MVIPCINVKTDPESQRSTVAFSDESVLFELMRKNCTMPDIKSVIFNVMTDDFKRDADGKKERDADGKPIRCPLAHPILTTRVEFVDGTWTVVQNSESDEIELEEVWLDEAGNVTLDSAKKKTSVTTASEASKEIAIAYSIWKRMNGKVLVSGEVVGDGAGRKLRQMVASARDSVLQKAKQEIVKSSKKREAAEKKSPPKKRASLHEVVEMLRDLVSEMKSQVKA